jgi:hypothetical protein
MRAEAQPTSCASAAHRCGTRRLHPDRGSHGCVLQRLEMPGMRETWSTRVVPPPPPVPCGGRPSFHKDPGSALASAGWRGGKRRGGWERRGETARPVRQRRPVNRRWSHSRTGGRLNLPGALGLPRRQGRLGSAAARHGPGGSSSLQNRLEQLAMPRKPRAFTAGGMAEGMTRHWRVASVACRSAR